MGNFELLMLLGVGLLFISLIFVNEGLPQACTEEALLCPDGSAVGRTGPKCEFPACPNLELLPYCSENIVQVDVLDDYIRTVSSLPGAGFSVYYAGNATSCPVVALGYMTPECRAFLNMEWNTTIECSSVDYWSYNCPTDYFELEDYKWINCEPNLFENFTDYCRSSFRQWIELNCDIDFTD